MSPTHMEAIGFTNEFEDDLMDEDGTVAGQSQPIPAGQGSYRYWCAENGLELWLQRDANQHPAGYCPHFSGESRVKVGLVGPVWFQDQGSMDGGFHGWANGAIEEDGEVFGDFPFDFEVPDFDRYDQLTLPAEKKVQITGFAHQLFAFESIEALQASQHAPFPMADESFFPNCSYDPIQQAGNAYATFTGRIQKVSQLTNPLTGIPFYWLVVNTYAMQVDIVASLTESEGPFEIGNVVLCGACLFGRFIE